MSAGDERWTAETLRLYRRYEREVVQAYDLCPWAAPARREGRVAELVLFQADLGDVAPSLAAIDALGAETDVALLIFPRIERGREPFERFAGRVRDESFARRSPDRPSFVFVAFHPAAEANLGDAERLIPFLRRTPDPTIQAVRSSVLDRVRAAVAEGTHFVDPRTLDAWQPAPPTQTIRERVAEANLATTLRVGVEAIGRQIADILRDRDETHRALEAQGRGAS